MEESAGTFGLLPALGLAYILAVAASIIFLDLPLLLGQILEPFERWFNKHVLGVDPSRFGPETEVGRIVVCTGEVRKGGPDEADFFFVRLDGELWKARLSSGNGAPTVGQELVVTGLDGLCLLVKAPD